MRSFIRSVCVFFELASSCASSPFNCVTDSYETGCVPCALAAPAVGDGPDCALAAVVHNNEDAKNKMAVSFIVWAVALALIRILQAPPTVHPVIASVPLRVPCGE